MKYLRIFDTQTNYTDYKESNEWVTPNISFINEMKKVNINMYVQPAMAGDVAYWDYSKIETIPLSGWNSSLGVPVGVVVVPEGFAPDRKIRIVSLDYVDKSGNTSTSATSMNWGASSIDTNVINYQMVPTTDNTTSSSINSNSSGYLPSDSFSGATSYVDSKSKYYAYNIDNLIPSPYIGNLPNLEYCKEIINNNALSDFNGLYNTDLLVNMGSDCIAANACWEYKSDVGNLQWYLPAMGELGYIMSRFNIINNTIVALGGVAIDNINFWSSTEYNSNNTYVLGVDNGYVGPNKKPINYVRPFAII